MWVRLAGQWERGGFLTTKRSSNFGVVLFEVPDNIMKWFSFSDCVR